MTTPDLKGKRFGSLTVTELLASSRGGSRLWSCLCDCGKVVEVSTRHLNRKNHNVKSCGCKANPSGSNHPQWSGVGDISGDWWRSRVNRSSDLRSKVTITLTMQEAWDLFLEQNRKCALSGVDLVISTNPVGNASIDRIDSSKGYELGNVQWVHKDVNFMKRDMTQERFIHFCKLIAGKNE